MRSRRARAGHGQLQHGEDEDEDGDGDGETGSEADDCEEIVVVESLILGLSEVCRLSSVVSSLGAAGAALSYVCGCSCLLPLPLAEVNVHLLFPHSLSSLFASPGLSGPLALLHAATHHPRRPFTLKVILQSSRQPCWPIGSVFSLPSWLD